MERMEWFISGTNLNRRVKLLTSSHNARFQNLVQEAILSTKKVYFTTSHLSLVKDLPGTDPRRG